MRWVLLIIAAAVAVIILLLVVGMLLPRGHVVTSRIYLRQPRDTVWSVIRDLAGVPAVWPDIKSSVRQADDQGRESWLQTMKNGFALPLIVDEDHPPSRLVTRIAPVGKFPFGGRWIYEVSSTTGGTELTVTEDGWVDNPFFRVLSRLMGHHATIDRYLRSLAARFGEEAKPEHLQPASSPPDK